MVNNNGTPVPVIIDHTMENNLLGFGWDFSFIMKPISNLRIGAGVSLHSLLTSTFIQEEQIRDKDNFEFLGANLPNVRNRQEGDIPNVNKLPLFLTGSIGYAINVSPKFQLVPEATFNYALSSFANELIVQNKNFQTTSDGSFKVNSLRLGIALLYNPTVTEELPSLNIEKPNQDSILLAQENEKKRVEADRLEKERLAKEKLEKERLAKAELAEKDRLAREEKERLAKEKLEKEQLAKAESKKNALQKERELKAEQERKIAQEKKKEEERIIAEAARLKLEQEAIEAEKKKELAAKEKERLRAEKEAKQEDINVSPECNVISSKPTIVVEGIAKKHNPEKPTAAKSAIVFENIITNNTICLVATEKGKFKVPVVDASTHYGFYAQKPGYYSTSQNIPIEVVTNQQQKLPPPPVTLFKVTDMEENLLNEPIVLNNVFFKFNKPELSVKAYPELDRLAELLLSNEKVRVEIHGFISKVEYDREFNKEKRKLLSSGRAKAVSEYLKSKGVKRSSMRVADEASISIEPNPLSFDAKESAEQAMCINVLFFGK